MEITTFIFNYVDKTVKDEDLKQEIFVKMLEKLESPTFENEEQERNWASAFIANHLKVSQRNVLNRARLMEDNDVTIRDLYGYNEAVDDPLDIVIAAEHEAEIFGGMSDLEKDIYGRYNKGQDYKEIAWQLGMNEAAVRKHMSRIRGKFNGKNE